MDENIYYVYGYYDENDVPFYIGKGTGDRMWIHLRNRKYDYFSRIYFYRKLNKLVAENKYFYYKKIKDGLSEKEAYLSEEILIAAIGRKVDKSGPLYNLATGGGKCGISDVHHKNVALYNKNTLSLEKTFDSVKKCAKFLNVAEGAVSRYFKENRLLGRGLSRFYVDYFSDIPNEIWDKKPRENKMKHKGHFDYLKTNIILIDIINEEELVFDSIESVMKTINCCRKTIHAKCKNNSVLRNRWRFKYGK